MKTLLLTNEYPPAIYGGAGVHVEFLSRELARLCDVEVRTFGDHQDGSDPRLRVRGFGAVQAPAATPDKTPLAGVWNAFARDLGFAAAGVDADVVHCHTWYVHLAGVLVQIGYGIPLVVTVHSLEPLRPWKREQLAGGYDLSCWVEKTALERADAVVAVSEGTRDDVCRLFSVDPDRVKVIYNGIDTELYRPAPAHEDEALARYGVARDKPYVLFVGRITRQKGIVHLVRAIPSIDPDVQVVLCAGAPDTKEIAAEMEAAVEEVKKKRPGVVWIQKTVPRPDLVQLYSHAAVFCCPSIYEPFGIINLEAMACGTPVVGSKVGGIPEVVVDGVTGVLVPLEQQKESPFEPVDPARFGKDLAAAINRLVADPALRERMARAGRKRVEECFAWSVIAQKTVELYASLVKRT